MISLRRQSLTTTRAERSTSSTDALPLGTRPDPDAAAPNPATSSLPGTQASKADEKNPAHKHFVLDTNVLLHNPGSIFMFEEHTVVIPLAVIEELDQFKKNNDETGRNSREVIRQLDRLRAKGLLFKGVPWNDEGGIVRIDRLDTSLPHGLDPHITDNRIIGVAFALHTAGVRTVFVSKDINARVKCDALGIRAEDFEADRVDTDWLYTGFARIVVPGELIDDLYGERQLPMSRLTEHLETEGPENARVRVEPLCNQYLILENAADDSHTGLARVLADTGHVIPVTGPRKPVYGIMARNVQQIMALDLLLDDEVRLVSLIGPAGTGKTLMAIAAGMQKVMREEHFDKLLVARPIMPLGRDIGYLPGDKDEKLSMWMQPIFDNLAYLMSTRGSGGNEAESRSTEQRIDALVMSGKVVMEPLTYIRGRSIPHQFMVVDEAQNLSPHEVKTIVSRVGDGTKIVLCGDIGQIDNPYLDASSNGLTHLIERMKGHRLSGHVTLLKTERSDLASLAAEIL